MTIGIRSFNQYTLFLQKQPTSTATKSVPFAHEQSEIERAFAMIASALRTVETEVDGIKDCLNRLSPAQSTAVAMYLEQLKQNKQKTQDIHYRYTEVCLASTSQHFTTGITPIERQLAERLMLLRGNIAQLIETSRALLSNYKLLGEINLPKNYGKSLASIKMLGDIFTKVFGGTFKYHDNSFRIEVEPAIYIEQSGKIYATELELATKVEQLITLLATEYNHNHNPALAQKIFTEATSTMCLGN